MKFCPTSMCPLLRSPLSLLLIAAPAIVLTAAADELPQVAPRAPVELPHFPSTLAAVVWRNWGLIETERLAKVLHTDAGRLREFAGSLGLPPDVKALPQMRRRGLLTLIRRNWHLLPYEQLVELLGITPAELAFTLQEDDGLYLKLGSTKPTCKPVRFSDPSPDDRRRADEIKRLVQTRFREFECSEQRFGFVAALSKIEEHAGPPKRTKEHSHDEQPRFIYSYFALFGDPLSNPELDPFPDGLLSRLSQQGVNGVWLHIVLRQLAPGGTTFPEWGEGHPRRLANLRKLVERAKRFGIDVYLYINEPRAVPPAFFANRREMAGVAEGNYQALCTSHPQVRQWLGNSLAHIFREVPDLGGIFTITASENLTNCASHGRHSECPHCQNRSRTEIIAEVNGVMAEGVHRSAPSAKVIVWDWGWQPWSRSAEPITTQRSPGAKVPAIEGDAPDIVARLPQSVWFMSVSEWSLPIERGGVQSYVGEYSISAVGPGPRASRHWELAKQREMKTVAKIQLNNTWELSSVPYLPVMDLVAKHCSNLAAAGTDGLMLSWSLGGYPSLNLELAHRLSQSPKPDAEPELQALAERHFGPEASAHVRTAWTKFSQALQEFPFHIQVVYKGPQQLGPANLLFAAPTGYTAGVLVAPYDDLKSWCGPYPPEVLAAQFQKVADGWADGLVNLETAQKFVPACLRSDAAADLRVAQAAHLHFASSANQVKFVLARDKFNVATDAEEKAQLRRELLALLDDEIKLAQQLHELATIDSRLGFEASNHYFYLPSDLMEKVINCEYLRQYYLSSK